MLVNEDGPGGIFLKLRTFSGITYDDTTGEIASWNDYTPLVCVWCTSIYVSLVLHLMPAKLVSLFAVSGLAVALDKELTKRVVQPTYIINESRPQPGQPMWSKIDGEGRN